MKQDHTHTYVPGDACYMVSILQVLAHYYLYVVTIRTFYPMGLNLNTTSFRKSSHNFSPNITPDPALTDVHNVLHFIALVTTRIMHYLRDSFSLSISILRP